MYIYIYIGDEIASLLAFAPGFGGAAHFVGTHTASSCRAGKTHAVHPGASSAPPPLPPSVRPSVRACPRSPKAGSGFPCSSLYRCGAVHAGAPLSVLGQLQGWAGASCRVYLLK